MKKMIIAAILGVAAISAQAVEVSVLHDYHLNKDGYRISEQVAGLTVSATKMGSTYTRYAVGKSFDVTKIGAANVSAQVAGVYQNTSLAQNGYGLTYGAKVTLPVSKSVDAFVGAERFFGQDRVKSFNGTSANIGLAYKF